MSNLRWRSQLSGGTLTLTSTGSTGAVFEVGKYIQPTHIGAFELMVGASVAFSLGHPKVCITPTAPVPTGLLDVVNSVSPSPELRVSLDASTVFTDAPKWPTSRLVGVTFSGGVDSAWSLGKIVKAGYPVQPFSYAHGQVNLSGGFYNEADAVREILKRLELPHRRHLRARINEKPMPNAAYKGKTSAKALRNPLMLLTSLTHMPDCLCIAQSGHLEAARPDNAVAFTDAFGKVMGFYVSMPTQVAETHDEVAWLASHDLYRYTYSCLIAKRAGKHFTCGRCAPCFHRGLSMALLSMKPSEQMPPVVLAGTSYAKTDWQASSRAKRVAASKHNAGPLIEYMARCRVRSVETPLRRYFGVIPSGYQPFSRFAIPFDLDIEPYLRPKL